MIYLSKCKITKAYIHQFAWGLTTVQHDTRLGKSPCSQVLVIVKPSEQSEWNSHTTTIMAVLLSVLISDKQSLIIV